MIADHSSFVGAYGDDFVFDASNSKMAKIRVF